MTNATRPSDEVRLDDERWAAVVRRDRAADGAFFYSVRTTGVYCRPSCGARLPRRENVRFHDTSDAAERAGFRPCKRCRPDEAGIAGEQAAAIARACRQIEDAETAPGLHALAQSAGMSPYHFHRVFKRVTGVTPRAYAEAHRARALRDALPRSGSVTQAIFDAGYQSSTRFYANTRGTIGMKPSRFRAGGAGETIRFAVGECSLGSILVAATGKGVCAILIGDDPEALVRDLQDRFPKADLIGGEAAFEQWVAKAIGLVEAPALGLDLPLDVRGTAFQRRVWSALSEIPPGTRTTYTELARRIGAPRSVRAVGQAVAANPIAIAVPCHRVVRTDGSLSGYRWGVERKRVLLEREARS